ncbi:MAG: hypothetical protein DRI61_08990 [Chloroflexi bacterium]|nr:MAG: hypothetical protein DRI61_08990 [Chloroflexota bacterium]
MYNFTIKTNIKFKSESQFFFIVNHIIVLYRRWLRYKDTPKFKPYIRVDKTIFALQNAERGSNEEMNTLIHGGIFCGWIYDLTGSNSIPRRWRFKFVMKKGVLYILSPNTKVSKVIKEGGDK